MKDDKVDKHVFFLREPDEDELIPLTEQMFKDDMQELIDYAERVKKNKEPKA